MTADRLPDCRPPRRDESVTSAVSHPELLCGYLAMRPRIRIPLTPAEQTMHHKWSRRTIGAVVLVSAGVLTLPAFKRETKGGFEARAEGRSYASVCKPWDEAASQAIAYLAQGQLDTDLRQVSDAVAQMRRARRSCELGWIIFACQDYQAIVRSASRSKGTPDAAWSCDLPPPT